MNRKILPITLYIGLQKIYKMVGTIGEFFGQFFYFEAAIIVYCVYVHTTHVQMRKAVKRSRVIEQ